jgi:hypothetical protein
LFCERKKKTQVSGSEMGVMTIHGLAPFSTSSEAKKLELMIGGQGTQSEWTIHNMYQCQKEFGGSNVSMFICHDDGATLNGSCKKTITQAEMRKKKVDI